MSEAFTQIYKKKCLFIPFRLFSVQYKDVFFNLFIGLNKLNNTYNYALNILVYLFVIINNIVCTKQPINNI